MSNWEDLQGVIDEAEHVLIVGHYNPDGDAIASTLILGRILHVWGKKFTMVNESRVPLRFLYLEGASEIRLADELQGTYSHVITVDCADIARVGECRLLFSEDVKIINIDHHKTNDQFGFMNFIDVSAASTTQILYNGITSLNIKIDVPLAEMIYTGLITDTGGFRYSNTTAHVMRISAELIEIGVDSFEIADKAIESITYEYVQLLQAALCSLKVSCAGQVAWIELSYQALEQFEDVDTDGLVQYTRNIKGVEVGVFFKESGKEKVKISFRSKNYFDVATFAKQFGGGGHARASGCTVDGALKDVQALILAKLEEELERTRV